MHRFVLFQPKWDSSGDTSLVNEQKCGGAYRDATDRYVKRWPAKKRTTSIVVVVVANDDEGCPPPRTSPFFRPTSHCYSEVALGR